MSFQSIENAKAYYDDKLGKYDKEWTMVDGKVVLLCRTPLAFDDEVDNVVMDAFEHVFTEVLDLEWQSVLEADAWDYVKPIVAEFIEQLCAFGGFSVEYISEEFQYEVAVVGKSIDADSTDVWAVSLGRISSGRCGGHWYYCVSTGVVGVIVHDRGKLNFLFFL